MGGLGLKIPTSLKMGARKFRNRLEMQKNMGNNNLNGKFAEILIFHALSEKIPQADRCRELPRAREFFCESAAAELA